MEFKINIKVNNKTYTFNIIVNTDDINYGVAVALNEINNRLNLSASSRITTHDIQHIEVIK